jgi:hypothetical protein
MSMFQLMDDSCRFNNDSSQMMSWLIKNCLGAAVKILDQCIYKKRKRVYNPNLGIFSNNWVINYYFFPLQPVKSKHNYIFSVLYRKLLLQP